MRENRLIEFGSLLHMVLVAVVWLNYHSDEILAKIIGVTQHFSNQIEDC
ncbi:unnamed protein product [Arabidopsis halleri]